MEFEEEFSEEAFLAESIQDLNLRLDLDFESHKYILRLTTLKKYKFLNPKVWLLIVI